MKKIVAIMMTMVIGMSLLTACGSEKSEERVSNDKLVIRYQNSVAYAPIIVMAEKGFISEEYGKDVDVDCALEADGNTVREGVSTGNIDIGCLGLPPALIGMTTGADYKIFSGIAAQPYSIVTNDDSLKTLQDVKDANIPVALLNANSQGHILLAKAAKELLGDAKAFDSNLSAVANADGYTGIESGSIKCHVVISPYNFKELALEGTHEIEVPESAWPTGDTSVVAVASKSLYTKNKDLYDAAYRAMERAVQYCIDNPEEVAQMCKDALQLDDSVEEIVSYMTNEKSKYSTTIQGVMDMAKFMGEEGFIEDPDTVPAELSDIAYDNVKGN